MALFQKKRGPEPGRVFYLSPDVISPNPDQPRQVFEPKALEELAASIAAHGILQPLSVRKTAAGYQLVAGERRLRAAKLAHLETVPCLLVEVDGTTSTLLALVENLQRQDLDFWEEALALHQLITFYHLSQEECARRIGKSQSAVANKLRLLKLPVQALEALRQAGLTERHGRALLKLPTPELQIQAANYVAHRALTVSQTEDYVSALLTPKAKRKRPIFVMKDVRLFLNTVHRGLSLMKTAGVRADYSQAETEDTILLTIRIPKGT